MAAARVAASASRGVRAPLRSSSGSGAARAALAVFPPAHAGGSGRLSWDSSPLRRLRSGSPVCRGLAAAGGEGCRPLAGAALGLRLPLGGFSFPGVSRPVKPRASLGFRPSESSPPGEPCPALPRPLLPCGFAATGATGAEEVGERLVCPRAPAPRRDARPPVAGRPTRMRDTASADRRNRRACSGPSTTSGLAGFRPKRPLRSVAPPGSPFSRRPRLDALARASSADVHGRSSRGLSPLQSSLHHDPGSGRARDDTALAAPSRA